MAQDHAALVEALTGENPLVANLRRLLREAAAAVAERDARIAELEAEVEELKTAHAVEVTGLLRSMMGYLTSLTASGSEMVTFVARKLEPYRDTGGES